MTEVSVRRGSDDHVARPDEGLTFGRAEDCTLCLDPLDIGISRLAGAVEFTEGVWWVANRSGTRPLYVIDDLGLRKLLGPGQRLPLDEPVWVVVEGTRGTHRLRVEGAPRPAGDHAAVDTGVPTAAGQTVLVSAEDRAAMVALFAEYLEDPPRSDPQPKSYRAAAARLGWPRTTLVKRIEYLRARLGNAGVPNMNGHNALTNLAEYALARRLVTKDDLRRLRGGPSKGAG